MGKRALSQDELADLLADPSNIKAGMPSLAELDHGITLIMKRHTVDAYMLRRRLKWLVRTINKEYGLEWQTPWE